MRLKGGDAFVFGRGSEEVATLAWHGIDVTVVPGVSSALGAPTAAGIPVTHRGLARSCTIVSGHLADDDYDWSALARVPGTIVVLMVATTAVAVAYRLLDGGRPPDEAVAIVHAATTADQRVARLSLQELATVGSPFPSPPSSSWGRRPTRASSR